MPRDGDALACRGRVHDRTEFGRFAAHRVLLVLLEHGVELERVGGALARDSHDEAAALRLLDLVGLEQMMQQAAQVVGAHAVEVREREHALRELGGHELAARGKRRHHLMIEQAVGQAVKLWGLHPTLFAVELYERDALQELPRDGLGQHRARLGLLLAHDEVHLGRQVAAAGAAHALQKRADGERRIDLEGALKAADVDAQLERGGGDGRECELVVAHGLFGRFAKRGGEIAVVDQKAVGLAHSLAVLAQHRADALGLLARVHEHQALAAARVLKDVADAGVRVLRGGIGGREQLVLRDGRDLHLIGFIAAGIRVVPGAVVPIGCRGGPCQRVARFGIGALEGGGECVNLALDALDRDDLGRHRLGRDPRRGSSALLRLRPGDIEVLHREAPGAARLLKAGDDAAASRARREKGTGALRVADGGGKPDAPRVHARHGGEALDKAKRLAPAVSAQK